jgi:hypothetical protein
MLEINKYAEDEFCPSVLWSELSFEAPTRKHYLTAHISCAAFGCGSLLRCLCIQLHCTGI